MEVLGFCLVGSVVRPDLLLGGLFHLDNVLLEVLCEAHLRPVDPVVDVGVYFAGAGLFCSPTVFERVVCYG